MLDVVSSENREKTLRFVLTFHGQATDKLPTGYRHITNSQPTVGRQVFWGALLHNYQVGDPEQARWGHLAFSVGQSKQRFCFILPRDAANNVITKWYKILFA